LTQNIAQLTVNNTIYWRLLAYFLGQPCIGFSVFANRLFYFPAVLTNTENNAVNSETSSEKKHRHDCWK